MVQVRKIQKPIERNKQHRTKGAENKPKGKDRRTCQQNSFQRKMKDKRERISNRRWETARCETETDRL